MWACFKSGIILTPVNSRLTASEVATLARVCRPRLFIADAASRQHAAAVGDAAPGCVTRICIDDQSAGWESLADLVDRHLGQPEHAVPVHYDQPLWYFFTSGTTGVPKAAILTHGQMAFVINNHLADLLPGLSVTDRCIALAPLTHGAGVHMLVNAARGAATVVPAARRFDADQALQDIQRQGVTNLFVVPTILKALAEAPGASAGDWSRLKWIVYAGAPMYRADQRRALEVFGDRLVQYYGLVEVTGAITVLPPWMHHADDALMAVGSCGYARTGMDILIRDPASGQPLAQDETGEICVAGPAVFAGYLDNAAATAKAMHAGFFHTGDVGHLDRGGLLYITGRLSDMFISGGVNIHPRDIEERLLAHPSVREVAVVGVPDAYWGEIGVAVIVRRDPGVVTEDELGAFLRERLAGYKVPRRFEFWDSIPKTAYGKVSRKEIRDRLLGIATPGHG
jgi:acyl-CoA synthetase (AMP-forming)/AMP-acid ligase II